MPEAAREEDVVGMAGVLPGALDPGRPRLAPGLRYDLRSGNFGAIPGHEETVGACVRRAAEGFGLVAPRLPGTRGVAPLLSRLAELEREELGWLVGPEDIVLTNGATHGLSLAGAAVEARRPGGGAVALAIPAFPYWWPMRARMVYLPFERPEDYAQGYADALAEQLRLDPGIELVIVNEPHNPFGCCLSDAQLRRLAALGEAHDLVFVVDDVARSLGPARPRWAQILDPARCVVIGSFTKRYGVPGLRLGWIHARGSLRDRIHGQLANSQVGVSTLAALCGVELMSSLGRGEAIGALAEARRVALVDELPLEPIEVFAPDHGVLAAVDTRGLARAEPAAMLRDALAARGLAALDASFMLPPGFDAPMARWLLRLSVAAEPEVAEALTRVREVVMELAS